MENSKKNCIHLDEDQSSSDTATEQSQEESPRYETAKTFNMLKPLGEKEDFNLNETLKGRAIRDVI